MARNDEIRVKIIGDERDLSRKLDNVQRSTGRVESGFGKVGGALKGFLGAAIVTQGFQLLSEQFDAASESASKLEQSVGGTRAVFGDSANTISQWAQTADQSLGLSESAFREGTTTIGAAIKRMTGDTDFAAKQSVNILSLAADSAATFGGTTQEAVEALGAAFRGEADPAERFGFGLSVTAVQAEAAEQGIGKVESGTKEYAEVLIGMIEQQTEANGALGQFGREADTAAGQVARHQARQENLRAALGENIGWWQRGRNAVGTWWQEVALGATAADSFDDVLKILNEGGLPAFGRGVLDTKSGVGVMHASMVEAGGASEEFGGKIADANDDVVDLSVSAEELSEKIKQLIDPTLNARDAARGLEEAIDAATETIEENGKTLDTNTKKGRENQASIDAIVDATYEAVEAAKADGAATSDLNEILTRGRKKFIDAAVAAGVNKDRARELATQLGLTAGATENVRDKTESARRKFVEISQKMGVTKGDARELLREYQAAGGETDRLRGRTESARKKFIEAAEKIGLTKGEARKLWQEYDKIPAKKETKFQTPGLGNALGDVRDLKNALAGLPAGVIQLEFKSGLGDGLGILGGLGRPGGTLMGVSASSAVGRAYSALGRPGDVVSGFRPGAITATGNPSYHGMGRALDITPSMAIFELIRRIYGSSTKELIFSPAGGRQIHNGRPRYYSGITRAQHFDHIHWAMAEGGYGTVDKPTVFLAGEAGREDFAFAPHSKGGMGVGGGTIVNITVNVAGSVVAEADLHERLAATAQQVMASNAVRSSLRAWKG